MKIIQKSLILSEEQYYLTHLNIINSLFTTKLTEKEIQIIAGFISLDKRITELDMFNTYARKLVKEKLNGLSAGSLSNHLKSMLDKGFLDKDEFSGRITIKPFLFPENNQQGYQFKIIKQNEKQDEN